MMLRHFQRTQRAYRPSYALGLEVRPGKHDPREPKVLVGDPDLFMAMSGRWNRYTQAHYAGVLSFEEDIPDKVATRLTEEFFDVLLPGARRANGQFLVLAVRHHEKSKTRRRRTGIHWFVYGTDLWRNRKLDVWPSRDGRRLETWQELVNLREGFGSPKDPHRSRALHMRAWPEFPGAAELSTRFSGILRKFPPGALECRDEIECALLLGGAEDVRLDHTRAGRFRARFAARAPNGSAICLRAIAAKEKRTDPLRRSFLRRLLGTAGFQRSQEVFAQLREQLVREIEHAGRRHAARHGIDDIRLVATIRDVRSSSLSNAKVVIARDETGMGFPEFSLPGAFPSVKKVILESPGWIPAEASLKGPPRSDQTLEKNGEAGATFTPTPKPPSASLDLPEPS